MIMDAWKMFLLNTPACFKDEIRIAPKLTKSKPLLYFPKSLKHEDIEIYCLQVADEHNY